jgi:hypothetical protein
VVDANPLTKLDVRDRTQAALRGNSGSRDAPLQEL